jgi:uncharacterized protein YkwD
MLCTVLVLLGACAPLGPRAVEHQHAGDAEIRRFHLLVNEHRVRIGCGPLEWLSAAAAVAEDHSRDMVRRGYFDHVSPEGRGFADRLAATRLSVRAAAENIAAGHADGAALLSGWLASPGHRANIENCVFTHHGLGRFEMHWTQLLVQPAPPVRANTDARGSDASGGARRWASHLRLAGTAND